MKYFVNYDTRNQFFQQIAVLVLLKKITYNWEIQRCIWIKIVTQDDGAC